MNDDGYGRQFRRGFHRFDIFLCYDKSWQESCKMTVRKVVGKWSV